MTKIYRYEVPVDDRWHTIELRGFVGAIGCRNPRVVEFWATHNEDEDPENIDFIVIGTGHEHPEDAYWVNTASRRAGNSSGIYLESGTVSEHTRIHHVRRRRR